MSSVTLKINREYVCDVLVCGGGVSGFSAAVSAARSGADVILVEPGGFLGGTATKGMVGPFMTCYDAAGKNRIIRGLFEELVERMVSEGGAVSYLDCPGSDSRSGYRTSGHIGVTPFDIEALKRVTEAMCLEAGVRLLYHNTAVGCDTDGGRHITRVYTADSEGINAIDASVFIDATGCAALAAKAGAGTTRGDENGFVQTSSMFFTISGVDKEELDKHMYLDGDMRRRFYMDEIEEAKSEGRFSGGTLKLRIFEGLGGIWVVNMAQHDDPYNELDSGELTKVEISQRLQILQIFNWMKETVPALKNIKLVATASDMGIRESRRIIGRKIFTGEDIMNAVLFDDRIAVCANSIDIHQKVGVSYSAYKAESNYSIPLGALISRDIDNLMAAGKCLSADKYAFAAVRVMPPCIAMGEAAGITAAIAALDGIDVCDVPAESVQVEIAARGGYLE